MSERQGFDTAVARMRAVEGGEVTVEDYFPDDGRRPYRYAKLRVVTADYARVIGELAVLAVELDAYLTMHVVKPLPHIELAVSRLLDAEEIGDEPPCASRPVEL